MKIQFYLAFTIIMAFYLTACEKDDDHGGPDGPAPQALGHAQSLYNGVPWDFEIGTTEMIGYPERYIFVFNHYNKYREKRGEFYINNITLHPLTTFLQELPLTNIANDTSKLFCDFYTLLSDGDVAGDRYIPLTDSSLMFTIDQIDSGNHISGRFWGKMLKQIGEMEYDPASPDTIEFSEGTYEVKLE